LNRSIEIWLAAHTPLNSKNCVPISKIIYKAMIPCINAFGKTSCDSTFIQCDKGELKILDAEIASKRRGCE
jgi:hypothetical protein